MKKLVLEQSKLSDEEKKVWGGELMNCLHKLKELRLWYVKFSPELKSKLKTRGDEVRCKVIVYEDEQ